MPTVTDALSPSDFERHLLEAAGQWPFEQTRFYRTLASGRCPQPVLRRFAAGVYAGAVQFCGLLATLARAAPDAEARAILLENLLEEEGVAIRPGTGLVTKTEARHAFWAERFLRACGGRPEDLPSAQGGLSADIVTALVAEGRWVEAVGFLLIGQEFNFAKVSGSLGTVLRAQGFAAEDLVFFDRHAIADVRHGREAVELVLARAHTAERQQAAIAAVERGARDWWDRHSQNRTGAPGR